jgi:hypothetical protein
MHSCHATSRNKRAAEAAPLADASERSVRASTLAEKGVDKKRAEACRHSKNEEGPAQGRGGDTERGRCPRGGISRATFATQLICQALAGLQEFYKKPRA